MIIKRILNKILKEFKNFISKLLYLVIPDKILEYNSKKLVTTNLYNYEISTYNIDRVEKEQIISLIDEFKKLINKNKKNTALDIGGNFGIYTLAMKLANFDKILVFEPNNEIYNIMVENFKKNNLKNILTFPYGIYDETSTLELSYPGIADKKLIKKLDKYSSGSMTLNGSGKNPLKANFKKYEDIVELQNIEDCDLIKIDVEGAELKVINEIFPLIKKFKPKIIIEINRTYLDQHKKDLLLKLLKENQYKKYKIFGEKREYEFDQISDIFDKIEQKKIGSKDLIFI